MKRADRQLEQAIKNNQNNLSKQILQKNACNKIFTPQDIADLKISNPSLLKTLIVT